MTSDVVIYKDKFSLAQGYNSEGCSENQSPYKKQYIFQEQLINLCNIIGSLHMVIHKGYKSEALNKLGSKMTFALRQLSAKFFFYTSVY